MRFHFPWLHYQIISILFLRTHLCERVFPVLLCLCCPLPSGTTSTQLCLHTITFLVKHYPEFLGCSCIQILETELTSTSVLSRGSSKCFDNHFRPLFTNRAFLNIRVMNGEENHANLSSLTVIYNMTDVHPSVRHIHASSHFFYTLTNKGTLSGFSRKIWPMKLLKWEKKEFRVCCSC